MSVERLDIYEINTATWLYSLGQKYQRAVNLSNIPSEEWDSIYGLGFNAVWLMGIWERSPAAIAIDKANPGFVHGMQGLYDDFDFEEDVIGSPYSVRDYVVSDDFGGPQALAIARVGLKRRGMLLILDYIPNHVAPDHAWVAEHPDYFIRGSEEDLIAQPNAYMKVGRSVFARGRDQEVDPWADVLQLDAFSAGLRQAMKQTAEAIAGQCDGIRCDAAMLMLNQVFSYTWHTWAGVPLQVEFWRDIIDAARTANRDFLFIAETYWDTEQQLLELGFDYCYDKNAFYDSIEHDRADKLFHMLFQPVEDQKRLIRFLEAHDERRAASVFPPTRHMAAAIMLAAMPSSRMYYEGQLYGAQRQTPIQIRRDPDETANLPIRDFYSKLLPLAHAIGNDFSQFRVCSATSPDHQHLAQVLAWTWDADADTHYLTVVNWSESENRAVIALPWDRHGSPRLQVSLLIQSGTSNKDDFRYTSDGIRCGLSPFQAVVLELHKA